MWKSLQNFTLWAGFVLLCLANAAQASINQETAICDSAAHRAAKSSDVPLGILLSITRVETGRTIAGRYAAWPWSANVAGKGYFFATQAEAMDFAQAQLAQGNANFDVGCFQINLRWHSKNFASLQQAFDPFENAAYAAEFLTQLRQSEGSWSAAVAAYHSRTPNLAQTYLQKVKSVWQKISTQSPIMAPVRDDVVIRENRYPLLQRGQTGQVGSLVPRLGGVPLLMGKN